MSSFSRDVLSLSDNEDVQDDSAIAGSFTRSRKKRGKSGGLTTSEKGKKRKTANGSEHCGPSRNGTAGNNPSTADTTPLTAGDIPAIVAAVVKSLREDPAQDTDDDIQPEPVQPG